MRVPVVFLACAICVISVASQQLDDGVIYEPVIVEVPGLLGKYGGWYLAAGILLATLASLNDDDSLRINMNNMSMVINGNGNGGLPPPS